MLETIAFTYSRGGVLALACALAVGMALSGARLRYLMWLGMIGAAVAPADRRRAGQPRPDGGGRRRSALASWPDSSWPRCWPPA